MPSKKLPPADEIVLLPPPAYSALPPPTDRPLPVTTVTAPEVRQPPRPDAPARSTTLPTPKAPAPPDPIARPSELRKQRSRKQSLVAPPGGLDKIDELDETDPLGFAWHHDSRYEGVKKVNEQGEPVTTKEKDVARALVCVILAIIFKESTLKNIFRRKKSVQNGRRCVTRLTLEDLFQLILPYSKRKLLLWIPIARPSVFRQGRFSLRSILTILSTLHRPV